MREGFGKGMQTYKIIKSSLLVQVFAFIALVLTITSGCKRVNNNSSTQQLAPHTGVEMQKLQVRKRTIESTFQKTNLNNMSISSLTLLIKELTDKGDYSAAYTVTEYRQIVETLSLLNGK
jgi:hypothetical protein